MNNSYLDLYNLVWANRKYQQKLLGRRNNKQHGGSKIDNELPSYYEKENNQEELPKVEMKMPKNEDIQLSRDDPRSERSHERVDKKIKDKLLSDYFSQKREMSSKRSNH